MFECGVLLSFYSNNLKTQNFGENVAPALEMKRQCKNGGSCSKTDVPRKMLKKMSVCSRNDSPEQNFEKTRLQLESPFSKTCIFHLTRI